MFNLFKTQTQTQIQKPNSDLSGLDLDNALFSIGVGLKTFICEKQVSSEKVAEFNKLSKQLREFEGNRQVS